MAISVNIGKPRVFKGRKNMDHDPTDIAEIILPLLNVDRPMTNGDKNP